LVLRRRSQEELLPHELQSSQTQATQPDLILQFREQGFYLLSLPLGVGELGGTRQLPCAFVDAEESLRDGWLTIFQTDSQEKLATEIPSLPKEIRDQIHPQLSLY
jgi:hypothetical protein